MKHIRTYNIITDMIDWIHSHSFTYRAVLQEKKSRSDGTARLPVSDYIAPLRNFLSASQLVTRTHIAILDDFYQVRKKTISKVTV